MKRLTVGTLMGVAGAKHDKQVVVKEDQMLRGNVQTKPRLRFQTLFYLLGDINYACELMDDFDLWAKDNDGVVDKANKSWILANADPVIDGTYEPPVEHQRAMQKLIDGRQRAMMQRTIESAARVSLEMDRRVLHENTDALKSKYAGDKLGWLYRASQGGSVKSQTNVAIAGNLMLDAGSKPRKGGKPIRIDKKKTSRMADVTEAEFREVK